MSNDTIYNKAAFNFLVRDLKSRLAFDSNFSEITAAEIASIIDQSAVRDFLDKHAIVDGKVIYIKKAWIGTYIQGQSLKKDFSIYRGILDMEALVTVCTSLLGSVLDSSDAEQAKKMFAKLAKMKKVFIDALGEAGVATVSRYREVSNLLVETDVTTERMNFEIRDSKAFLKLPFKRHDPSKYLTDHTEDHIREYEEHFTDIRAVVEWICAIRFGPRGRQDSYLHIQAPSGFGKTSVFMNAWKSLNYGHETTLHNIKVAVSGATGSETAINFVNASVVFIDEANKFTPELKNLTNTISITEKFKGRVEVPIYAKIMASKEDPTFLQGETGDKQVINRFSSISYVKDKGSYREFLDANGYKGDNHTKALKWLIVVNRHPIGPPYRRAKGTPLS